MDPIMANAFGILDETCKKYAHHDKDIMQGIKGERLHALDCLSWVKKLNPRASISLKLAALFHDVDRIVTPKMGGGFKGDRTSNAYIKHKKAHAKRSARFIIPILKKQKISPSILARVEFLVLHHDDTGEEVEKINNDDLNILVAADSFTFFSSIAPTLYQAEGEKRIKDKIRFMVDKMPNELRIKLWEFQLASPVFEDFKNDIIREYYILHNPREKAFLFCPTCKARLGTRVIDKQYLRSCQKCGFIFWNNPKPCVSVLIEINGKILLLKRVNKPLQGYWCLPGGYINYAETPQEAAARETYEETGLSIYVENLVGVYQIDTDPQGINIDIIYKGSCKSKKIALSDESSDYKFFSPDALPQKIAYRHRNAILDWQSKQ